MAKTIEYTPVMTKAHKRWGQVYPAQPTEHNAVIVVGESIRIFGEYCKRAYDLTFKVGDVAVYGSYNLIYTGRIVSIGAKTVTIQHYEGVSDVTQLDINSFCWRNADYDAARIAAQNHETSMCI